MQSVKVSLLGLHSRERKAESDSGWGGGGAKQKTSTDSFLSTENMKEKKFLFKEN